MAKEIKHSAIPVVSERDEERATLIDEMLTLSSKMVEILRTNRGFWAADQICEMLLPYISADAVSITDTKNVLAYRGYLQENYPHKCKIRTKSTKDALEDGQARTLLTQEDIGFPESAGQIHAAIVEPIIIYNEPVGVLKFYFRDPKDVLESQITTAHGFARLIATQLAASEVEQQRELSTLMELKMLQNQINPHFLFNTISTISSYTRTDPEKARRLLRQFAAFYRSTLEQDSDLITLAQEIENVERYGQLQQARFGEDKLKLNIIADEKLANCFFVPPFTLQPIVENSIRHGMSADDPLSIIIEVRDLGSTVHIEVRDDGKGMERESVKHLFEKREDVEAPNVFQKSSQLKKLDQKSIGLGLAMNNVYERIKITFGQNSEICADSELGQGTKITFKLPIVR